MDQNQEDKIVNKIIRSEWTQILTVIIAVAGLFFWSVSVTSTSVEVIRQDIKDFHGRLCTLEEKYYQLKLER